MRFLTHGMDSAGIDPAIVEIEESADGDGIVNGLVAVADGMQGIDIRGLDGDRFTIDLADEAEESFLRVRQTGCFGIGEHTFYQFLAAQ